MYFWFAQIKNNNLKHIQRYTRILYETRFHFHFIIYLHRESIWTQYMYASCLHLNNPPLFSSNPETLQFLKQRSIVSSGERILRLHLHSTNEMHFILVPLYFLYFISVFGYAVYPLFSIPSQSNIVKICKCENKCAEQSVCACAWQHCWIAHITYGEWNTSMLLRRTSNNWILGFSSCMSANNKQSVPWFRLSQTFVKVAGVENEFRLTRRVVVKKLLVFERW